MLQDSTPVLLSQFTWNFVVPTSRRDNA